MTVREEAITAIAPSCAGIVHNADDGTYMVTRVLDALTPFLVDLAIETGELEGIDWDWRTGQCYVRKGEGR